MSDSYHTVLSKNHLEGWRETSMHWTHNQLVTECFHIMFAKEPTNHPMSLSF